MAQSTIILTNSFADGTTRKLTMGTFTTSAISLTNIRNAVKNLNQNPATIATLYLSDSGAQFQEVSQVQIQTEDKTVII